MTDREMLELAAKAAGMRIGFGEDEWFQTQRPGDVALYSGSSKVHPPPPWNPLRDDGDALRLAVKLHMNLAMFPAGMVLAACGFHESGAARIEVAIQGEPGDCRTIRYAITQAAAQVGAEMGTPERSH